MATTTVEAAVREAVDDLLASMNAGDAARVRGRLSSHPGAVHIGTDPQEWWSSEDVAANLGNVEEVVSDYHIIDSNPAGRAVDPTGPPPTSNRVTCGGSYAEYFRLTPEPVGVAGRSVVYSNQGFRVVLEPR